MGQTTAPIRDMFDGLVSGYDRFNALSSMGMDVGWRSKVSRMFSPNGHILDIGTGTGDLARSLADHGCKVIGVDFSPNMIQAAKEKMKGQKNISLQVAHAESLPYEPRTFDGITSAFLIRNLHHGGLLSPSFREFYRVLKPGGRMVHLELTKPENPVLAWGHKTYLEWVLPLIGRGVFGNRWPKDYLSKTIEEFPTPEAVCHTIHWAGFESACHYPLSGGIASLFIGTRC